MKIYFNSFYLVLFLFYFQVTFSQNITANSLSTDSKRLKEVLIPESVVYVASVVFLRRADMMQVFQESDFNILSKCSPLSMNEYGDTIYKKRG